MSQPQPNATILIVDDEKILRDVVKATLGKDGYSIYEAAFGRRSLELIQENRVDLILLDIGLPDGNGLDFIAPIRKHTNVPIVILSGRDTVPDKTAGLESGADDYIAKPFHPDELRARVRACLRRYQELYGAELHNKKINRIKFGTWILDRARMQVLDKNNCPQDISIQEFYLLETLILGANRVLRREELISIADDDHDPEINERAIDVRIARIRKKIGDSATEPDIIKTIRGAGYMLACDTEILE